jgi:endonuclease III
VKRRKERALRVGAVLEAVYPSLQVSLDHGTPLELLVATILSAQCTDERVNKVTPALFARYPRAADYAVSETEELEALIRPTGFYRNKAKNIRGMARTVVDRFDGRVPATMDELLELPGVARKTANVVLSNAFDRHEGVVVDTHVKRVARRLGFTSETNPVKVERDLMGLLPREEWRPIPWRLILHGRNRCSARKPDCAGCEVRDDCPSADRAV